MNEEFLRNCEYFLPDLIEIPPNENIEVYSFLKYKEFENLQLVTNFAKTSILDVRLDLGCTSAQTYLLMLHLLSQEYRKGLISRFNALIKLI